MNLPPPFKGNLAHVVDRYEHLTNKELPYYTKSYGQINAGEWHWKYHEISLYHISWFKTLMILSNVNNWFIGSKISSDSVVMDKLTADPDFAEIDANDDVGLTLMGQQFKSRLDAQGT